MDDQQKLFGLMAIAEEHQKAVEAAIKGLDDERRALAKERTALEAAARKVQAVAGDAVPAIQKAAEEAVGASVRRSLSGAAETASKALEAATAPVVGKLEGVVQVAGEAEGYIRDAGKWFAWKWVAMAAGGTAGVCVVAYMALAAQLLKVRALEEQRAELEADITAMSRTVEQLEKRGGGLIVGDCEGRLCFEASTEQVKGKRWEGAVWRSGDGKGKRLMVIPKGY